MNRRHTLSGAILAQPAQFSVDDLVRAAEELLRDHATSPLHDALTPSLVNFYADRQLVDAPARDAAGEHYTRRHLLQLTAVQVLRGLDLSLDEIGELVRGVDEANLRLLVDDPAEAEKKANVMRNWLGVIARGRYRGPSDERTASPFEAAADGDITGPPPLRPGGAAQVIRPERAPPPMAVGVVSRRTIMGAGSPLAGLADVLAPSDLPTGNVPTLAPTRSVRTGPAVPDSVRDKARASGGSRRENAAMISDSFIVGERYVRHELAAGISLHVSAKVASGRLSPAETDALVQRVRELLAR